MRKYLFSYWEGKRQWAKGNKETPLIELKKINYPILWGGHPVRPMDWAGETPTPQEYWIFFDLSVINEALNSINEYLNSITSFRPQDYLSLPLRPLRPLRFVQKKF